MGVHWKDRCWSWSSNTFATWCEELIHFEKTLMLGKIEGRAEGDDKGGDGWMASPTLWTWVWANSGSWWWTGRPGVLQSMRSQRVGHDWATELNCCHLDIFFSLLRFWKTNPAVKFTVEFLTSDNVYFICILIRNSGTLLKFFLLTHLFPVF